MSLFDESLLGKLQENLDEFGTQHANELGRPETWKETETFLMSVVKVLLDYLKNQADHNTKVLDFQHPEDLRKKAVHFELVDFAIPEDPQDMDSLIKDCELALKHQVRTGHPRFYNQLSCGINIVSLAGEWLTAAANTNMFTYEIAPVFILMEREVLQKMWEIIGWTEADGIFAPGGAVSNLYAVNAARHHLFPRIKPLGMGEGPKLAMFTSEDSHYSMMGAAAVCGIGTDRCFLVATDNRNRIIPEDLEQKIAEARSEGLTPFFVAATAGTTVYGSFDPIHAIADIAKKNNMWMHVDCNQMSADYLFQQDKPYDVSYDTGDKAFQCGRHNDVFKFWLLWRAKGMSGFEKQMDSLMEHAAYFTARLKDTPGFEMVLDEPEYLNICFWYVPPSLRNLDLAEKNARLEKIAPKIKGRMMEAGTTMVGYQPDKRRPNFFRMVISNPAITRAHLDWLIQEITRLGHDL